MAKTNAERQAAYRARKRAEGLRRDWVDPQKRLTALEKTLQQLNKAIIEKDKPYFSDESAEFMTFLFKQVERFRPDCRM